jgi:uncharacterized membrane protein YraQ (UPF0718 family)
MEREELEKKLIDSIEKLDNHIERYEKDLESINLKFERLQNELNDAWNALKTTLLVFIIAFAIMAITWFFPFQAARYAYLGDDDVRRKLIALSVEAFVFGFIIILMLVSALSRRFRD